MTKLRVLVACEYSGRVREAFRKLGHDAWSCDLLPSEDNSQFHYQRNVEEVLDGRKLAHFPNSRGMPWDLMIAHPPCTDLAVSGARHFAEKIADGRQARALEFVRRLMDAPIPMIAIENPISVISSKIRKPDQIIQPWMFGHPEFKATCLWLKDLPKLTATNQLTPPKRGGDRHLTTSEVEAREREWASWNKVHRMPPGPDRWKERSRTYQGIADAMASQWAEYATQAVWRAA